MGFKIQSLSGDVLILAPAIHIIGASATERHGRRVQRGCGLPVSAPASADGSPKLCQLSREQQVSSLALAQAPCWRGLQPMCTAVSAAPQVPVKGQTCRLWSCSPANPPSQGSQNSHMMLRASAASSNKLWLLLICDAGAGNREGCPQSMHQSLRHGTARHTCVPSPVAVPSDQSHACPRAAQLHNAAPEAGYTGSLSPANSMGPLSTPISGRPHSCHLCCLQAAAVGS